MRVCVLGLGYVGLPLAMRLSKSFEIVGFDVSIPRINNLNNGIDTTNEFDRETLYKSKINFTNTPEDLVNGDVFIITVPTPVDESKSPDFSYLSNASHLVGTYLNKGNTVIYESTVYPGATREFCVPILERVSGLSLVEDFHVAYSPERVSPGTGGQKIHQIEKIISSSTPSNIELLKKIYGVVTDKKLHVAPSIEVAEFAKVLENTQRDLNIALINEVSHICSRLDIKTRDVIEAAATKWNFVAYSPGFVGGHCIGVDPYYLLHKSEQLGYSAEIITAGRRVNETMTNFVVKRVIKQLSKFDKPINKCHIGIFGMTFKEDCPDMRNSKSFDLVSQLLDYNVHVSAFDPYIEDEKCVINATEVHRAYDAKIGKFDFVIIIVPHQEYIVLGAQWFLELLKLRDEKNIFDVKSLFPNMDFLSL